MAYPQQGYGTAMENIADDENLRSRATTDPAGQFDLKRAGVEVRRGFLRKVYGLLSLQLVVTVLIAAQIVVLAGSDPTAWVESHGWLLWVSVAGTISVMCASLCCREATRSFPTNYIILFSFTAFESILIGLVSAMFTPQSVLLAAGATALLFGVLTGYAMLTKTDFTGCGPYIFAGLTVMLIFGLVLMLLPLFGVPISVTTVMYDCLGVILFSFCIIFDTQMMLGEWGGYRVAISVDEYVFAALNLYLDILNIFLHFLSLFGERR